MGRKEAKPVPGFIRFYFYGIQGFADEIVFTALFDFLALDVVLGGSGGTGGTGGGGGWSLRGHSSLSSFFIYGTCSFMVERLYVFLYYKHGVRWYIRIPLYVCIAFSWEFLTGLLLRQFNACPWDYSHYTYNIMGLITLEYAPGWAWLAFLQDVMAEYLLRLRVVPPDEKSGSHIFLLQNSAGREAPQVSSSTGNGVKGKFQKPPPDEVKNGRIAHQGDVSSSKRKKKRHSSNQNQRQ